MSAQLVCNIPSFSGSLPPKLTTNLPPTTVQKPKRPTHKTTAAMKRKIEEFNQEERHYGRKMTVMKRMVKSLVFKNAALCDEVARLNMRIAVMGEERKFLVKRLVQVEKVKKRPRPTREPKVPKKVKLTIKIGGAEISCNPLAGTSAASTPSTSTVSAVDVNV